MTSNYHGVNLKSAPAIRRSLAAARFAAASMTGTRWIVMGTPGEFLVVCPADFERLTRAGFEAA